MENEFENVKHNRVNGLQFLINDIIYRHAHLHFDTEIIYVISGEGQVNTQQTEYSLHAGQMMVFNSCQVHEFKSKSSIRLLILQLPITTFAAAYPALDTIVFDSRPINPPEQSNLVVHLVDAAKSFFENQDVQPLLTVGLTYIILYDLLKLVKYDLLNDTQRNKLLNTQKRMQRISARIQNDYVDGLSLQDLAEQEGFSRNYFSHFFKENFGIAFQDYLTNIRCERGYHLLLTTNENLLSITSLSGFSDVRAFNRAFKERYGSNPKDFRKQQSLALSSKNSNLIPSETKVDIEQICNSNESLTILKDLSKAIHI
jgi:AraC-like DNA-binding protein